MSALNTTTKPRLLFFSSSFFPIVGGAERQAQNLARILTIQGFSVQIVTRSYPGSPRHEEIDGVPVTRLFCGGPKITKIPLLFISSALFFFRHRKQFDIIHVFQLDSHAFIASILNIWLQKKIIVKMANIGRWGEMHRLQGFFGSWRKKIMIQGIHIFVSLCQDMVEELESNGVPRCKIQTIPTGVDVEHYQPVSKEKKTRLRHDLQLSEADRLVVFTGRLSQQKGLDVLFQAWRTIESEFPQASLLILGTGVESATLQNMVGELKLRNVKFLGQQAEVLPYLQAANLFCLPSRAEGFSNSLLEAMACGVPAVATAYGGARDIIIEGENGYLVQRDNIEMLQTKLALFLRHPDQSGLGKQARNSVVNHAAFPKVVKQYISLYQQLVSR